MIASAPIVSSPLRQSHTPPSPVERAMELTRGGQPRQALEHLSNESSGSALAGDVAAATALAELHSTRAQRIKSAASALEPILSAPDTQARTPLQVLAVIHLQMVRGELTAAELSLFALQHTQPAPDNDTLIDGCLLGVRLALLRDDVEMAQSLLMQGSRALGAAPPPQRARMEAASLMFGVIFDQRLGLPHKLIGLSERLGPGVKQLLSGKTPIDEGQPTASNGAPGTVFHRGGWQDELLGSKQAPDVALLLWAAARSTSDIHALAGDVADLEPAIRRRWAQGRLDAEQAEMGFAGELLHVLLASRSEQSYQRALLLKQRYPDSQDLEQLRAHLAAHVRHQPLPQIVRRIGDAPHDLSWLELGIELALEIGNGPCARHWSEQAWQIMPSGRTAAWRVRAAELNEMPYRPLRRLCEQAMGFLDSSATAPFVGAHAMRTQVQLILAQALVGDGDRDMAKGQMLKLLAENPGAVEAHLRLGDAEFALGNKAAAEQHYSAYLNDAASLMSPLASSAHLARARARLVLGQPRAAKDDLVAISPNRRKEYEDAQKLMLEVDELIALRDMGVRKALTLAELREMVRSGEPRETDLTLRDYAKRPQNIESVEFLTLMAKNNYRMGRSHDPMALNLCKLAIVIAMAEGREATEAKQIHLDINRRNPSLFKSVWAALHSVTSWFSSTVVNTGAP